MKSNFRLSKELEQKIVDHPEINWDLVFKKTIITMINRLELVNFMESKLENSTFTEDDAMRLGDAAKQNRQRELKSKGII